MAPPDRARDPVRVAVTGGTGFVGGHVVHTLLDRGHEVRLLARRPARAGPSDPRVHVIAGSLFDAAALRRLTEDAASLIHLVGIIVERGRNTFTAVHVDGARAVAQAAREAGCRRLVHMSALGARDEPGATPYHRTKARGEQAVGEAGVPVTVLRPSIISGPGSAPIRTLARMHRWLPAVPVFGDGSFPVQPIWVGDVAAAFAVAAEGQAPPGTFELGGPEPLPYASFVRAIGRAAGHSRPQLHLPLPLVRMAAAAFDLLGPRAPLTSGQLQMLVEGSATPRNALASTFGVTPLPFEEGLRRFLG